MTELSSASCSSSVADRIHHSHRPNPTPDAIATAPRSQCAENCAAFWCLFCIQI